MQLEAGKCYVDRKGRVFGPLVRNKGNTFGEGSYSSWYPDGRQSFQCEMPTDLIAEHVPFVSCSHFVTPVDGIVFTVGYGGGGGASDPDEDFVGDTHMIETEHIAHVLRPGVDSVWNGNAWIPYTGKKTSLGMTKYPRARFLKSAAPVALPRDINYIPRYADGWKPEEGVRAVAEDMLDIIFSRYGSSEERMMAASTLVEAVYPEILARKQ